MRTGNYDGVSASGDATLRLIAAGDVAPVNTKLIPNYADVFDGLKNQKHNSVDGQMYGIPARTRREPAHVADGQGRRPLRTRGASSSTRTRRTRARSTAYDSPIYIADAALYLMKTQPDLGIKNPYALDDKQFQAAVDLLKQQREIIGEYWSRLRRRRSGAFKSGDTVLGTTWQVTRRTCSPPTR